MLNTLGKYMLAGSVAVFLFLIISVAADLPFWSATPEWLMAGMFVLFFVLFCLSFSFIFYHSETQKRKKAVRIIAWISGVLLAFGILSKLLHAPGAAIEITLSCFLFSLGALPLIIKMRYENRRNMLSGRVLALSIIDLFSIAAILMGLLFRLLHWPGSEALIITGGLLLVLSFIFWNVSFRKEVKLRQEVEEKLRDTLRIVEEKHLIIEEKNKEITDSINYARGIQEAILPSMDFIRQHLPDSFVYYQPKDIVAGDFYWAERVGETMFVAAADCTGHGVPGALVSMVCSSALSRSVKEFGLADPGKILDKTRELVLESFSKKGEAIKDGMDISLLGISGNSVKWAGANNPLWYVTKTAGKPELKEITADKQPIGKTDNPQPFTTHHISIQKGDLVYLFTDGYADQFGGPKGKKFKYKQLADLLLELYSFPLAEQSKRLNDILNQWRGDLERVDDVCLIGIKV